MRSEAKHDRTEHLFENSFSSIEYEYHDPNNGHLDWEELEMNTSPTEDNFIPNSFLNSTARGVTLGTYLDDPILKPKSTPAKLNPTVKFKLVPINWDADTS